MFSGVNERIISALKTISLWRLAYVELLFVAQLLKFSRITLVRELVWKALHLSSLLHLVSLHYLCDVIVMSFKQ